MHSYRAFVDLLLNALAGVFGVAMVLTLMANPKVENQEDAAKQPGNMVITATWPEGNIDVDLWVQGPGDSKPVGYSNREGTLFNLLRDDLGTSGDTLPLNYENAYSRGLPAGQYVVNLHCFKCREGPVPVNVEIRYGRPGYSLGLFLQTTVTIASGQERTVSSFRLNDAGAVVGTPSNVLIPLREGRK